MRDLISEATYFLDSLLFWLLGLVLSKFCYNYATQIAYCAVFGFTEGAYLGMTSVITIDLIGMETFVHASGLQFLFMGAACLIGPPIIGEFDLMLKNKNERYHLIYIANSIGTLHAATGDYDAGFYFAGAMILVSGIMLFLLPSKQRKTEWTYGQFSMNYLDVTLSIQSAVALQLGILPPMAFKRPIHTNQNVIQNTQGQNSDTVVTHL